MLMKSLNEALMERKVDAQYATLTVLLWEPRLRRLTLSNAGAEPLFICRKGVVQVTETEGVPIGLLENQEYEESEYNCEPGDTLLLFSDGLEDQLNERDQQFSRIRVKRLLQDYGGSSARAVVDHLFMELDEFRDGVALTDDQTAVVMKVVG